MLGAIAHPSRALNLDIKQSFFMPKSAIYIVYGIESAAYGVIFTSCLCQNPNERGTSE